MCVQVKNNKSLFKIMWKLNLKKGIKTIRDENDALKILRVSDYVMT